MKGWWCSNLPLCLRPFEQRKWIIVPSWLSPIAYYLSSQADVYGSVLTLTAPSHRLWKQPSGPHFTAAWNPLSNKYTVILHVMCTCTRHIQMRTWRMSDKPIWKKMPTEKGKMSLSREMNCPVEFFFPKGKMKRSDDPLRFAASQRSRLDAQQKQQPTLSKQSRQAIFISQPDLCWDQGRGWNFLYRNLASPDQKPVGISSSKRENSQNDARHRWSMRSSQGPVMKLFAQSSLIRILLCVSA